MYLILRIQNNVLYFYFVSKYIYKNVFWKHLLKCILCSISNTFFFESIYIEVLLTCILPRCLCPTTTPAQCWCFPVCDFSFLDSCRIMSSIIIFIIFDSCRTVSYVSPLCLALVVNNSVFNWHGTCCR